MWYVVSLAVRSRAKFNEVGGRRQHFGLGEHVQFEVPEFEQVAEELCVFATSLPSLRSDL